MLIARPTRLLVACLALAACSGGGTSQQPSASPAPSALPTEAATTAPTASPRGTADPNSLPDGWVRVQGDGFSVDVPDSWRTISTADLVDAGAFDAMRAANPESAAVIDQAETAMRAGQIQLFAFDPGTRTAQTGFASNLNVIRIGDPGGEDVESLARQMASAIALQIPISGEVETETTTLPAGDAAVLRYRWTIGLPDGGSADVAVTQYLVVTVTDGYILTMSGVSDFTADDSATWRTMAESLRPL